MTPVPGRPVARIALAAALTLVAASPSPAAPLRTVAPADATSLGTHVVLSWNDLGMHCMNKDHADFSVLPPFNTLVAQVIERGDATRLPRIVTSGVTIEYSVPGNTTSVGKTDFWQHAQALFGVTLPPDVGLAGKGLTGTLDPAGAHFTAVGIPVTPFTDAAPTVENPYQQALLVARDGGGAEIARSTPVIPVSTEINCVSSGCHSSINSILNGHEREQGFDPNQRPILCARCHASPALGTTGNAEAGYFSRRIHDKHSFIDQQIPGQNGCYKCHPGPNTLCLRGAMSNEHGLECQNCHGNMRNVARSIEDGRVPWAQEPACGTCHLSQYAEPAGQLYRNSTGHGGVMCAGCHNSPHADLPSRVAADNANNVALQGHAGTLRECVVCHGTTPSGPGPHGVLATSVGDQVLRGVGALRVTPNPVRVACTIELPERRSEDGRVLVFDAGGRTLRVLDAPRGTASARVAWDARDQRGDAVPAGTYFVRWQAGERRAAARVVVVR